MVDSTLEKVGKLAGQFDASYIRIVGHTDGSMKGKVPFEQVKTLSRARAEAVKAALIKKFPQFPAEKFVADGVGWNEPADPEQPNNHALNRRVEITVLQPEAK
jgi:flagellar motor protein MotB